MAISGKTVIGTMKLYVQSSAPTAVTQSLRHLLSHNMLRLTITQVRLLSNTTKTLIKANMIKITDLLKILPNKVRITKDVAYEIVYIDEFNDNATLGECRYDQKQIVINRNQSKTETVKTILHEIVHAIAMENDIKLTETHVLGLENGLWRFLKLNGLLK